MKFLKNFDWSFKSIMKVIGVLVAGMVALVIAISLIGFAISTLFSNRSYESHRGFGGYAEEMAEMAFDGDASFFSKSVSNLQAGSAIPLPPSDEFSGGLDAEDFEVKNFNATIRTRDLDRTCDLVAAEKAKDYIIFESSNKNKENCYYRFKVKKENEKEVIDLLEGLRPESFNANITSIKKSIENTESELDILSKKLTSIEETLEDAQLSYDSISEIATRQQDAETLAKIIDSKLKLINQLSRERLNIKSQIERYNKSKAEQLDRLNFTFFNVNVYKDVLFDWKDIKESWKFEIRLLTQNINETLQGMTIGLVGHLAKLGQALIYLFLALFLVKYVWKGVKRVWTGGKKKPRGRK